MSIRFPVDGNRPSQAWTAASRSESDVCISESAFHLAVVCVDCSAPLERSRDAVAGRTNVLSLHGSVEGDQNKRAEFVWAAAIKPGRPLAPIPREVSVRGGATTGSDTPSVRDAAHGPKLHTPRLDSEGLDALRISAVFV